MESKVFSFRTGIKLEQFDNNLMLSAGFDKKEILKYVKELLNMQNFNIDESSVSFEIKEHELFVEGIASAGSERKSIGFLAGK